MQKLIYRCDACNKEMGAKKHISLVTARHDACGIALPPTMNGDDFIAQIPTGVEGAKMRGYWEVNTTDIYNKFLHFCNGQCIGRYFSKRMKAAE